MRQKGSSRKVRHRSVNARDRRDIVRSKPAVAGACPGDGGHVEEGCGWGDGSLEVPGQSSIAIDPGEESLDQRPVDDQFPDCPEFGFQFEVVLGGNIDSDGVLKFSNTSK